MRKGRSEEFVRLQLPPNKNLKSTDFVDTII
jgi:hypothetical protein